MTLDWNSILPAFAAGLIASVISPWINWRIERVRLRHQSRKEKIQDWRKQLEEAAGFSNLQRSLLWEELKPYLTKSERKEMFMFLIVEDSGLGSEELKLSKLLGVVAKIQKEWGII